MGLADAIVLGSVQITPNMVVLSGEKNTTSKIQVAKQGSKFKRGAREFSITESDIDAMVKNSLRTGTQIPLDYNHLSLDAVLPDQALAAGWFQNLSKENGLLYGDVEWTPKAALHIQNKEFRYISPVIGWNAADEFGAPIGTKLISAALTIYPFLKDMEAVSLMELISQRVVLADLSLDEKRSRLSQAIRDKYPLDYPWVRDVFDDYIVFERSGKLWKLTYTLGADFAVEFTGDPTEVIVQYDVIAGSETMPNPNPNPGGGGNPNPNPNPGGGNPNPNPAPNPNPGGGTGGAAGDDAFVRLNEQVQTLSATVNTMSAQLTSETARANTLQTELLNERATKAVEALTSTAKIKREDTATYIDLYKTNKEMFDKITATLRPVVALNTEHGSNEGDASLELQEEVGENGDIKDPVRLMDKKVKEHVESERVKGRTVKYADALKVVSEAFPKLSEAYRGAYQTPTTVIN